MDKHTIITIGRQYGSGGREIGQKLAERLGIKCYDNELLSIAAKESGYARKYSKHMMKNLQIAFCIHLLWIHITHMVQVE